MSLSLEGRVAVITGGTTGIGLAIAKEFVAESARASSYVNGVELFADGGLTQVT